MTVTWEEAAVYASLLAQFYAMTGRDPHGSENRLLVRAARHHLVVRQLLRGETIH